jgi:hypothetical protein
MKGEYTCLECKEYFENGVQAKIHHQYTKHEEYYLIGTDVTITVKNVSPKA